MAKQALHFADGQRAPLRSLLLLLGGDGGSRRPHQGRAPPLPQLGLRWAAPSHMSGMRADPPTHPTSYRPAR